MPNEMMTIEDAGGLPNTPRGRAHATVVALLEIAKQQKRIADALERLSGAVYKTTGEYGGVLTSIQISGELDTHPY